MVRSSRARTHAGGSLLVGGLDGSVVLLLLGGTLVDQGVVLGDGLLLGQSPPLLQAAQVPPPLQPHGGDEPLDLGSLGVRLGTLGLAGDFTSDDKLPDVVVLAQVEEPPDLGGPLGSETLGEDGVGKTGNVVVSLLDDDDREDGNVGVDDASTDRLALALAVSTGSVTRVTVGQQESDTVGKEDSLLHRETCGV